MKVFITVLTGAIIGYITNWLAIKMLFRPREEKRLFGFKIPFTPGVIPKEKSRIAKSVAETIDSHLLTKDTIINSLCSDNINKKLELWVIGKVHNFSSCSKTIEEKLRDIFGEDTESILLKINKAVESYIIKTIKREDIKEKLVNLIMTYIEKELKNSPKAIIDSEAFNRLSFKIIEKVFRCKEIDELHEKLRNLLRSEVSSLESTSITLREAMPKDVTDSLKEYLMCNKDSIVLNIKAMINEEDSKIKIKKIVLEALDKNLNPMVAMFLNKDSICDKAINTINEFMEKEENKEEIIGITYKVIDRILEKKVKDVVTNLSDEAKEKTILKLTDLIIDRSITVNNLENIKEYIHKNMGNKETIKDIVVELDVDYYKNIKNFIHRKIDNIIENPCFCGKVQNIVNIIVDSIMNKPINGLFKDNEKSIEENSIKLVNKLYSRFIENQSESFIETLNIKKIVEEKINSFDVIFAEKIILEIASKELNVITYLGGVLGAIMGLISFFISRIY
ncbi:DUF445 family protein [Haloimpatiens sp. FM7315]|uniref:DUF445 family protein n=1 Tax=Haloimpatiens sp. FM7315 TaxID=3298609 RepID=UPI0035A3180C